MTTLLEAAPTFTTDFTNRYAESLREWGRSLAAYSGPIVAISRKGPRLLELAVRASILPESLLRRVTTERGLFLDSPNLVHGDTPVLCDDCIIVGSTFQRLFEIMLAFYPNSRVIGLPFALSQASKIDRRKFVERAAIGLADDAYTSFVNAETAAFASLDKPYDLDHPILTIRLRNDVSSVTVERSLRDAAALLGG